MRTASLAVLLLIALTAPGQTSGDVTVTGFVTDTWCGRKGASEKHADHARRTVASGVAQYAVYDEATRKLYILDADPSTAGAVSGQAAIAQYAGQRVKVTLRSAERTSGQAGTLTATLLRHAGQSGVYPERSRRAPDAVAAYKDPSAPNGLRASAATTGNSTTAATPTAAISDQGKVQNHEDALDQTTPIAGP